MTTGEWIALASLLLGYAGAMLLALDERMRRKFATRDDLNEVGKKIESTQNLFVNIDDRVGAMETSFVRMDERQTQQFERVSEKLHLTVAALEKTADRMEQLSTTQQMQAIRIEQLLKSTSKGD